MDGFDWGWEAQEKQTAEHTETGREGAVRGGARSRAGRMAMGLPHSSGLCGSAGVTVGMASLAACSTRRAGRTLGCVCRRREWVESRAMGRGHPGRLESRPQAWRPAPHQRLPHKSGVHQRRARGRGEADHRQDCRCGTQDCALHGGAGVASLAACSTRRAGRTLGCVCRRREWVESRAMGRGHPGRLESRPQAWRPAPQDGLPRKGDSLPHKTVCPAKEVGVILS